MSERAQPFHCPYCGGEDLWPHDAGHGAWECRSCLRAFQLKMLGLVRPTRPADLDAGSAADAHREGGAS